MHFYIDIFDGNIKLAKAEEDQEQFKSDLNEITRQNSKKKSEDQIRTIENIKNLYKSNCIMIMLKLYLKLSTKQNMEKDLKY